MKIRNILAGATLAVASVAAIAVPAHAGTVHTAPDWAQRTCNAFAAYQARPGKAALEVVVTDSFHLADGKPGLASDIGQLWADYAGGGRKYIPGDIEYVRDDCGGAN